MRKKMGVGVGEVGFLYIARQEILAQAPLAAKP